MYAWTLVMKYFHMILVIILYSCRYTIVKERMYGISHDACIISYILILGIMGVYIVHFNTTHISHNSSIGINQKENYMVVKTNRRWNINSLDTHTHREVSRAMQINVWCSNMKLRKSEMWGTHRVMYKCHRHGMLTVV